MAYKRILKELKDHRDRPHLLLCGKIDCPDREGPTREDSGDKRAWRKPGTYVEAHCWSQASTMLPRRERIRSNV
jgi:hypothetical protein